MAGSTALACAAYGGHVGWVVPVYLNARAVWRFAERMVFPIAKRLQTNKTERMITFPSGGNLSVYTADNPVGILGEAFDLVVLEEAARLPPDVWAETIMPTLADNDGRAMMISTPRGRNWFWQEFQRGLADGREQAAFTAPSVANPMPTIQRAAELARGRVSERTYRQEWLAEFVEDGAFFQNVTACATAVPQAAAQAGHGYHIGVDWARAADGDYTVFAVVDATLRHCVHLERFAGMEFERQLERLQALWQRFGRPGITAEYNSLGGPLVERLQSQGLPVAAFTTTAESKHTIISALELAFDRRAIAVINDAVLVSELQTYEKVIRPGWPRYGAPSGMHDDTVMALALAWYGIEHTVRTAPNPFYD